MALSETKSKRWYAFSVSPQREFHVLEKLTCRGHCAFIPVVKVPKRVGRHGSDVGTFPMLPGYIFLGFEDAIPWQELLHEHLGLRFVLGTRAVFEPDDDVDDVIYIPSTLNADDICELSDRSGEFVNAAPELAKLVKGGKVKILTGPFASFFGQIERISKRHVTVTVHLFGKPTLARMPKSILQAA